MKWFIEILRSYKVSLKIAYGVLLLFIVLALNATRQQHFMATITICSPLLQALLDFRIVRYPVEFIIWFLDASVCENSLSPYSTAHYIILIVLLLICISFLIIKFSWPLLVAPMFGIIAYLCRQTLFNYHRQEPIMYKGFYEWIQVTRTLSVEEKWIIIDNYVRLKLQQDSIYANLIIDKAEYIKFIHLETREHIENLIQLYLEEMQHLKGGVATPPPVQGWTSYLPEMVVNHPWISLGVAVTVVVIIAWIILSRGGSGDTGGSSVPSPDAPVPLPDAPVISPDAIAWLPKAPPGTIWSPNRLPLEEPEVPFVPFSILNTKEIEPEPMVKPPFINKPQSSDSADLFDKLPSNLPSEVSDGDFSILDLPIYDPPVPRKIMQLEPADYLSLENRTLYPTQRQLEIRDAAVNEVLDSKVWKEIPMLQFCTPDQVRERPKMVSELIRTYKLDVVDPNRMQYIIFDKSTGQMHSVETAPTKYPVRPRMSTTPSTGPTTTSTGPATPSTGPTTTSTGPATPVPSLNGFEFDGGIIGIFVSTIVVVGRIINNYLSKP